MIDEKERKAFREEVKQTRIPEPKDEEVLTLLKKAIRHEGTLSAVAKKIGYSKATTSLIRSGKYFGSYRIFYAKLKKVYDFFENGVVMCPGIKGEIHLQVCRQYRVAIREGKILKGAAFAQAKDMCPFCPAGAKT
ncbi:MAG: hypothetical protein LBL65_05740 [Campylobacteraceae bacterium]|jgi:hypothetical protein|nr:hypothetical protein [Campylobacteraceae bacterium]